ncbi:hypothetical protein J8M20_23485 [Pseudoalteromonas luteoviolacea]|uniref:hypothetical protein n=1 Tax=Pseudoalteromonas luteoviolacea TaxID=43657 RepID=UPI001B361EED|nr:hypothetical protein [Pseudoalteromonas luteoviolacea]MBQ4814347.1 hypothetical protein [Pseudoalteromonas luteoviolacea]
MEKIMLTRSLLSAAIILSLSGCGGSSSDNSSTNSPITPTVEKVVEKTIQLETVYRGCENDEAMPNIDIVFHNANGEVVAIAKTDVEGKYTGKVPETAKHVSAIESGAQTNQVFTYMEISEGVNLGKIYFEKPSSLPLCPSEIGRSCESMDVDVTDLAAMYSGYKLVNSNGYTITELGGFRSSVDLTYCEGEEFSYLAVVSPSGDEAVAAKVSAEDIKLQRLKNDAFTHEGIKISTPMHLDYDSMGIYSLTDGSSGQRKYEEVFFTFDDTLPFIFPSLAKYNNYRLSNVEQLNLGNNDFRSRVYTYSRSMIANDGTVDLELPVAVDHDLGAAFFAGNANNSFEITYDFSHLDNRLNMLRWSFDFTTTHEQSVQWSIQSDVVGTLPDLQFGDVLDFGGADFSALQSFRITLSGHPHAPQNLNDYRAFLSGKDFDYSLPEYKSYINISYHFTSTN